MPPAIRTPVGDAPVIPVAVLGIGAYLAWFGIHYWKSDTKWPTDPVKSVLQGKGVPKPVTTLTPEEQAVLASARQETAIAAASTGGQASGTGQAAGTTTAAGRGSGSSSRDANVNTGKLLAAGYGWGPGSTDWPYLYSGWEEESGWNALAANVPSDPYNHAYGIPQANPGTKMASAGSDWKTNPATQIKWGLAYIKGTYGAPSRVPGWSPNGPLPGYTGY